MSHRAPIAFAALLALSPACRGKARAPALAEELSVEQPGGSAAQLFAKGSELPESATESFTTARAGARRIVIHVLRGGGRTADKLRSDGVFFIDGVRPAPAGEPRVLVTFALDGAGGLSLSAREEDTRLSVRRAPAGTREEASPLSEPAEADELEDDPGE